MLLLDLAFSFSWLCILVKGSILSRDETKPTSLVPENPRQDNLFATKNYTKVPNYEAKFSNLTQLSTRNQVHTVGNHAISNKTDQNQSIEPLKKPQKDQQSPPRRQQNGQDEYLVGVGIADITGPAADINIINILQQIAGANPNSAGSTGDSNSFADMIKFQYPSWREFRDVKLQLKINFRSLLLQNPLLSSIFRWAIPNQIKMQAEYTYANLIVQL